MIQTDPIYTRERQTSFVSLRLLLPGPTHIGASLHRRQIFPDLPPATQMEAVGARLGRSSSRYGTTTVFNGPVRKWKKKWVHVAPPSNHHTSSHTTHHSSLANGTSNSPSHLLLFKWTPISQSNKENNGNGNTNTNNGENKNPSSKDDGPDSAAAPAPETPPRRKFRYVPVAALEEQQKDTEVNTDDEARATDTDTNATEPTSKSDSRYENPDINDIPMEEDQDVENDETVSERQDLNKSTLDLSLG